MVVVLPCCDPFTHPLRRSDPIAVVIAVGWFGNGSSYELNGGKQPDIRGLRDIQPGYLREE